NFKVLKEGPVQFGSLQGQELVYENGAEGSKQRLRLIYLQDGESLYTVTLQCAAAKCDGYQAAFDSILNSLKLPGFWIRLRHSRPLASLPLRQAVVPDGLPPLSLRERGWG